MIRRKPTLIPMTDSDVQDVRDLVAQQKAEEAKHQALMAKMKRLAESPTLTKEDIELQESLKALSAKYEKNKRLGLDGQ